MMVSSFFPNTCICDYQFGPHYTCACRYVHVIVFCVCGAREKSIVAVQVYIYDTQGFPFHSKLV